MRARTWAEVVSDPRFQELPPERRERAREVWFNEVVVPNLPNDKLDHARQAFDKFRPEDKTPLKSAGGPPLTGEILGQQIVDRATSIVPKPTEGRERQQQTGGQGSGIEDVGRALMAGAARVPEVGAVALHLPALGVRAGLRAVGADQAAEHIQPFMETDIYRNVIHPRLKESAEAWQSGYSPKTQAARRAVALDIAAASQDVGDLADFIGQAVAGAKSMVKNPRALGVTVVESVPDMITGMGAAGAVGRPLYKAAFKKSFTMLTRAGMTAKAATRVANKAGIKASARSATAAAAGTEASQATGYVMNDLADSIADTPDDELVESSPRYAELRKTLSEAQAKSIIASEAMDASAGVAFGTTLAGTLFTGAAGMMGRVAAGARGTGAASTLAGKIGEAAVGFGKGAVREGSQEFVQGGGQKLAENVGAIESGLDPNRPLMAGVPSSAGSEAVAGVVMGAPLGAFEGRPGDAGNGRRVDSGTEIPPGQIQIPGQPPGTIPGPDDEVSVEDIFSDEAPPEPPPAPPTTGPEAASLGPAQDFLKQYGIRPEVSDLILRAAGVREFTAGSPTDVFSLIESIDDVADADLQAASPQYWQMRAAGLLEAETKAIMKGRLLKRAGIEVDAAGKIKETPKPAPVTEAEDSLKLKEEKFKEDAIKFLSSYGQDVRDFLISEQKRQEAARKIKETPKPSPTTEAPPSTAPEAPTVEGEEINLGGSQYDQAKDYMVRNQITDSYPAERIAELTGLPIEDATRLKVELRNERRQAPAVQEREDGETTVAEEALDIVHGSTRSDLTADSIEIVRTTGQKQGKKGRVYGGFYGSAIADIAHAEGYANMVDGTPTIYDVKIKPGTKILNKTGDITRLTAPYIDELVSQGYGVVVGKDPRGRTEYAVIDKNAIASMSKRSAVLDEDKATSGKPRIESANADDGGAVLSMEDIDEYNRMKAEERLEDDGGQIDSDQINDLILEGLDPNDERDVLDHDLLQTIATEDEAALERASIQFEDDDTALMEWAKEWERERSEQGKKTGGRSDENRRKESRTQRTEHPRTGQEAGRGDGSKPDAGEKETPLTLTQQTEESRQQEEAVVVAKDKAHADKERAGSTLTGSELAAGGAMGGRTPTKPKKPKPVIAKNTIVTDDMADAARARLRATLGRASSGVDPETLKDGMLLTLYHVERGAHTFTAYAKAMLEDMGELVRPFLKSWYLATKFDPRSKNLIMSTSDEVEKANVDAIKAPAAAEPLKPGVIDRMPGEEGTEIVLALRNDGRYAVSLRDADSNTTLPSIMLFDDIEQARAKMKELSGKGSLTGDAAVIQAFKRHFANGGSFATIREARAFYEQQTGRKAEGAEQKRAEELLEAAIVSLARDIVSASPSGIAYDQLVDLYERQPNLGTRTSTSVETQAYSTPAPLALIASTLAGITKKKSVLEPTAGTGMLLIEASPAKTTANELSEDRAQILRDQGFRASSVDAATESLRHAGSPVDVVIANPPFGTVRDGEGSKEFDTGLFKTTEIDHAIVFNSLQSMKEDGTAVLIVGGVNKQARSREARSDAYNGKSKRTFYYHLYQNYNVVDHFTVAGELYQKQGAGWPVDVIVIRGTGKSAKALPAVDVPPIYNTWDALRPMLDKSYEQVDSVEPGQERVGSGRGVGAGERPTGTDDGSVPIGGERSGATSGEPVAGSGSRGEAAGGRSGERGAVELSGERESADSGVDIGVQQPAAVGGAERPTGAESSAGSEAGTREREAGVGARQGEPVAAPAPVGGNTDRRNTEIASDGQIQYEPTSQVDAIGTLVPTNMRTAIADSLDALQERVGSLDEFVSNELGYAAGEVGKYFSAEQIDAIALGLDQMKAGKGFIIGDQCVAGETPILDPTTGISTAIEVLARNGETITVLSLTTDGYQPAQASAPFLKGEANLYRVTLEGGRSIVVTAGHRFLTRDGWGSIASGVEAGMEIAISSQADLSRDRAESTHLAYASVDGFRSTDTVRDCPPHCWNDSRRHGEQLHGFEGMDRKFSSSPLVENTTFERIAAIQFDRFDAFYDMLVPGSFNYVANGIVNHNTGIGKGRVVAAMIRYALRNGKTPIFVTEKPNLYADMYRDLNDIGVEQIKPIMTDADQEVPLNDDGTIKLKTKDAKKHSDLLEKLIADADLGDHNIIFTTYSQMQMPSGKASANALRRRSFLETFAKNGIVILDESHNAGGTESAQRGGKKNEEGGEQKVGRAGFVRALVGMATGVFYSSATYAKRPSVMDLYFKTDMALSVANIADLPDAIARGGVPLQQVVAAMLTKAGQYIRRERTFSGVEYNTTVVDVNKSAAEQISGIMLGVKEFDDSKEAAVKTLKSYIKDEAAALTTDGSIGSAGATSTNFTSIMHNLIDQMLLTLKIDDAAKLAIAALKRGEKPVITVSNTMGSFIEEYAEEVGVKPGDAINLSFGDLLRRYLERSREVLIKDVSGKSRRARLTDEQLGPSGVKQYNRVLAQIEAATSLSSVPISPIDRLHHLLSKEGYSSSEITGRTHMIEYGDGAPVLRTRQSKDVSISGRRRVITKFNSGDLDVLILNQAGATGLSLHASKTFKDQRRRRMIIAQAEKNIDTHMQMLGRIHRTGQVIAPAYDQLVADIPAEKRPAAVLAKKMASLNANTTAARGSQFTSKEVVDFMNDYGDEVVAQLMSDMPEIHEKLGEPLGGNRDGNGFDKEGAARKTTGRIPILPVAEQEALYAMIEASYAETLSRAEAMGSNALEAKTLDLDARTMSSVPLFDAKSSSASPFAAGADLQMVDVKRLGKPYTSDQVLDQLRKRLDAPEASEQELRRKGKDDMNQRVSDTSDAFTEYSVAQEKSLTAADSDQKIIDGKMEILKFQLQRWSSIAESIPLGATYRLVTSDNVVLYGVATEIKRKAAVKNPVAPGAWSVTFAVADGMRQITLPFSKIAPNVEIDGKVSVYATDKSANGTPIMKMFDDGQTSSREQRVIVTGNLLAGYSEVRGGQIVHYTTDTGRVQQGILMPRSFDVEEFAEAQPVQLTAAQVIPFLGQATNGYVTSNDGNARVTNYAGTQIGIYVPKSKADGGRYFLNEGLRAIVGDFVSSGNSMRAIVDRAAAQRAIDYMASKMSVAFSTTSFKDEARYVGGTSLADKANTAQLKASSDSGRQVSAFDGMTREQFLGNPKITSPRNADLLRPRLLRSVESSPEEPFYAGAGLTAKYSEDGSAVFDGGKLIASYNFGETLVVDRKYRRRGIGEELVYQWRVRNPEAKTADERTKAAQSLQENVWDRIQRELKAVRNAAPQPDATRQQAGTGTTAKQMRDRAITEFGQASIAALEKDILVIVDSAMQLPMYVRSWMANFEFKNKTTVQAIHDGKNGKVYIIADRLTTSDVRRLFLHEIGEHYGLKKMIGDKRYAQLQQRIVRLHELGNKEITAAWNHVLKNYGSLKPGSEKFISEVIAKAGERAQARSMSWWQELVKWAKDALFKMGFTAQLNDDDIRQMVLASLHAVASGEIQASSFESENAAASRQTDTTAFRSWFGDSVVTENGKAGGDPLVVYHGTHSDITEFKPNDALGGGIFFSPDAKEAGAFALANGANIIPVYLRAEHVWPKIVRSYDEVRAIASAKDKGYDAVRVKDAENGVINWVVFRPEQIKSAIGNRGTFDPNDPDISASAGGPDPESQSAEYEAAKATDEATSIKNAQTARDRAERGFAEREKVARKSDNELWQSAKDWIGGNFERVDALVEQLTKEPRQIDDREVAVLLHQKIRLESMADEAMAQIELARKDGDQGEIGISLMHLKALEQKLERLYDVVEKVGIEQGRSLRARQLLANRDFSLVALRREMVTAGGGVELTPEMQTHLKELSDRLRELEKWKLERERKDSEEAAEEYSKQVHGDEVAPPIKDEPAESVEKRKAAAKKRARDLDKEIAGLGKGEDRNERLPSLIQRLAKELIAGGVRNRDKLIDGVRDRLKEHGIEMERGEVRDAISGYGQYKELSKAHEDVIFRQLKGEMQEVSKIEALKAGQMPLKTGVERQEPSDEKRRLTAEVNELKRQNPGLNPADPDRALKTATDAIKTRLRNQITDVTNAIKTQTPINRSKTPTPETPEIRKLRDTLANLNNQYEEMFPKKGMTEEQKAKLVESSLERQTKDLERRIREGDISPKGAQKSTITNQKIKAMKARLDALREELKLLRDAARPPQKTADQKEIERLTKRIEEVTAKIDKGDLTAKAAGKRASTDPEVFRLRHEAAVLNAKLNEMRWNDPTRMEERHLKSINDSADEYARAIIEGDLAPREKPTQLDTPALTEARKRRDALRETLKQMRENSGILDAKRIAKAMETAQAEIESLNARIKAGDTSTKTTGRSLPHSPELEALRKQRAALQRIMQKMRRDAIPDDVWADRALQARKTNLANRTAELQERKERGDFEAKQKRPTKTDTEERDMRVLHDKALREFLEAKAKWTRKNWTMGRKLADVFSQTIGLFRGLLTMDDLSAIARQGNFMAGRPIKLTKAVAATLSTIWSETDYIKTMDEIRQRDNYVNGYYARAKLFFADDKLSRREEAYLNRWLEVIPIVKIPYKASERVYNALLNRLRADVFDAMIATTLRTGAATEKELRGIGYLVNNATGRGTLINDQVDRIAAEALFSPKFLASRFAMATFMPVFKAGSNRVRKQVIMEYGRYLASMGILYTLAAIAGADFDEDDPEYADFWKWVWSNVHVDPLGGFGQAARLMLTVPRMIWDGDPKLGMTLARFGRSKLAPVPGAVWSAVSRKDFLGNDVDLKDWEFYLDDGVVTAPEMLYNMTTPMSIQSIVGIVGSDTLGEEGADVSPATKSVLVGASFIGVGVNVYD